MRICSNTVADPGFFKWGGLPDRMIAEQLEKKIASVTVFVPFLNFKLKQPQRGGWPNPLPLHPPLKHQDMYISSFSDLFYDSHYYVFKDAVVL